MPAAQKNAGGEREAPPELELAPGVWASAGLCAWLKRERTIVAADAHLGFEAVAAGDGAYFPRRQKAIILARLKSILDRYRPELFVVAGDFKHNFSQNLRQEMDEVGEVLGFLDSRADVAFVRGNHDNYLQALLPEGAALPETLEVGEILIAHGHKETELVRRWRGPIISAHEHPSLKLRDGVGARVFAPAFVHDAESGTLVLPALSPLARGSDILWGRFLSPVLRRLDRDRLRVIAVAGSGLLDFGPAGRIFAPGGPSGPEGVGVHSQIRSAKYYIG